MTMKKWTYKLTKLGVDHHVFADSRAKALDQIFEKHQRKNDTCRYFPVRHSWGVEVTAEEEDLGNA